MPRKRQRGEKIALPPAYRPLAVSAQQTQYCLRQLVGLGQHRGTGLLHDLVLGQIGSFYGVVGVHDAAAGC